MRRTFCREDKAILEMQTLTLFLKVVDFYAPVNLRGRGFYGFAQNSGVLW